MSSYRLKLLACFLAMAMTMACVRKEPTPEPKTGPDPVLEKIQKSAQAIHDELIVVSRANQQKVKDVWGEMEVATPPASGPLSQLVTLRWTGPVHGAVQTLADLIGYNFQVLGEKPIRDKLVNIDAIDKTAFLVLRDLGIQAGENVGIFVDPEQGMIELNYLGGQQ